MHKVTEQKSQASRDEICWQCDVIPSLIAHPAVFLVSINPNKVVPSDFAWLHGQCAWTCAYCKAFPPMYLLEEHDGREPPQLPRASPATRWKTTIDYRHHEGCEVGEIPKKILKWNFRIGEFLKVVEDSEVKTAKTCRQKRNEDRRKVTEEK